jgi:hypothetical protein
VPLTATYSEATLAAFMASALGDVAVTLGWAVATDMTKLETLAIWLAWEAATASLASRYDFSTDGQSQTRSQLYTQAVSRAKAAAQRATPYRRELAVGQVTVTTDSDPYAVRSISATEFGG